MLRAELTHRYGVAFGEIVNGQAEIAGVPTELLQQFSKRAAQVDDALAVKVDEFRQREGRDPSRFERAALEREAAADTRLRKTGHGVPDLRDTVATGSRRHRCHRRDAHRSRSPKPPAAAAVPPERVTVGEVIEELSAQPLGVASLGCAPGRHRSAPPPARDVR